MQPPQIKRTLSRFEIKIGDWIHLFDLNGKYFDSVSMADLPPMQRVAEFYKWMPKRKPVLGKGKARHGNRKQSGK